MKANCRAVLLRPWFTPRIIQSITFLIMVLFHTVVHAAIPLEQDTLLGLKQVWSDPRNYLSSWIAGRDCSKWYGVTCDSKGYVIQLYLVVNRLSGPIPSSISNLKNLKYLGLAGNKFSGPIPSSLGNLKNLKELYLSTNRLFGPIPSSLGNLKNLQYFDLNSNQLSGSIPSTLGNLKNLKILTIRINKFSGPIPSSLGNLKNLMTLNLGANRLSGSIPSSLGNLKNLQYLYLDSNKFSGSIPSSISNLTNLKTLYLNHNQLSDAIPKAIHTFRNLASIDLSSNYFTGTFQFDCSCCSSYYCNFKYNCLKNVSNQRSNSECSSFCGANSALGPCGGRGTCAFNAKNISSCSCDAGWSPPNCQFKVKPRPPPPT